MMRSLPPALRRTLGAALLAFVPLGGALAQGGGVPVTTDPVRIGPVPVEILANGLVSSESVVTIRTRVDGQIERVLVAEGQMVRRGQPLFILDSRMNQALLAQQEAQLARDKAQAARAQADAQRYQSLRGESFASQQRFEQAQADSLAGAANVRATEALIAQTRLNIEFATITAEIDGQLGAIPLRAGNFVRQAENTAITTLTQMDPILVSFAVPERWLPAVRTAMQGEAPTVRAHAEGDRGPWAEGRLVFVDSAVDTTTGTILLKARFQNADNKLWPGQYVQVTLAPRTDPEAITVAGPAVQTGQQGRYVFVLAPDGTARRRPVEFLRTAGDRAVVKGELAAGEKVIVDGAQRVTEGTRAMERGAAPAPQRVSSVQ
ncbi:efflux RND transporter periplasmic adaptor subunit [Paracraurococcus lichenis]|uniref:Efflux RND transporter periplasmic adaptor subunit n=1 Tax=Paracraurococcus lichenis TaxID=3064888 RepID=A0ABT9DZ38_9PROT|nr:efflux RND transporter periplasmic adaptor subunit [Paracraurococcus sp. LOR1-02]MDO9709165.1 efflux RND transporter periplasmic adaptor subunit [Paracraurococcus sp. LOR1-02]